MVYSGTKTTVVSIESGEKFATVPLDVPVLICMEPIRLYDVLKSLSLFVAQFAVIDLEPLSPLTGPVPEFPRSNSPVKSGGLLINIRLNVKAQKPRSDDDDDDDKLMKKKREGEEEEKLEVKKRGIKHTTSPVRKKAKH